MFNDHTVSPKALTWGLTSGAKLRSSAKGSDLSAKGCSRCHWDPQVDRLAAARFSVASLILDWMSSMVASGCSFWMACRSGTGSSSGLFRSAGIIRLWMTRPLGMSMKSWDATGSPRRRRRPSATLVSFASLWRIAKGLLGKAQIFRALVSPGVVIVMPCSLNFLVQSSI